MPDYIMQPGYTGPNPSNISRKDVLVQVTNGMLAVGRPPMAGVDRSITTSTAAQTLMPANTSRMGFYLKNDTAIDVWFNIGGTATIVPGAGNLRLPGNGGYFESGMVTPSEAISIIAASGTPAITAREF